MKKHFEREIIERPRTNSSAPNLGTKWSTRAYNPDQDDDQPSRINNREIKRIGHFWCWEKSFNDNLGPLYRYLRKQVGRPWNKVQSEVLAAVDKRTIAGDHLVSHLKTTVEIHPLLWSPEGKPLRKGYKQLDEITGFYVDRKGFLRYIPFKKWKWDKKEDPNVVKLGPGQELKKILGVWYRIGYKMEIREGKEVRVDTSKRQLSTKELREREISNDPPGRAVPQSPARRSG